MKLGITDHIDCAHYLPDHPKCGQLHGHTYKVELIIEGDKRPTGMVLDFEQMRGDLHMVLEAYDHQSLNDFLEYPSVENICELLKGDLEKRMSYPFTLRVWEGEGKWAEI